MAPAARAAPASPPAALWARPRVFAWPAVDLRSWLTRRRTESAQEKADRMLGRILRLGPPVMPGFGALSHEVCRCISLAG
jgi:hypothetical protein